ncbi:MAG: GIY-YIG nuclease family protein [Candidatus Zipacnadales bacterium]
MMHTPPNSGVYIFLFDLYRPTLVQVGALGEYLLEVGRYAYVGSARRGLRARVARHSRQNKPVHWHIDYLQELAKPVGAICWPWMRRRECTLAALIEQLELGVRTIRRFGASDCRCSGHLLYLFKAIWAVLREA